MATCLEATTAPHVVLGAVWCHPEEHLAGMAASRLLPWTHSGVAGNHDVTHLADRAPAAAAASTATSTPPDPDLQANGGISASLAGWMQRVQQKGQVAVTSSARAQVVPPEAGTGPQHLRGEPQEVGHWMLESAQKGMVRLGDTLPPQMRRAIRSSFSTGSETGALNHDVAQGSMTGRCAGSVARLRGKNNEPHGTGSTRVIPARFASPRGGGCTNYIRGELVVPQDHGRCKVEAPEADVHGADLCHEARQATVQDQGMQQNRYCELVEINWRTPQPREVEVSGHDSQVDTVLNPSVHNGTRERQPVSAGHAEQHQQGIGSTFSLKQLREKSKKLQKFVVQHADVWADVFAKDEPHCGSESSQDVGAAGKLHRRMGSNVDAKREQTTEQQKDHHRRASMWQDAQRWLEANAPQMKKQWHDFEEPQWDEEEVHKRKQAKRLKEWRRQRDEDAELLERELADLRRMRDEEIDAFERACAVRWQARQQKDLEPEARASRTSALPAEGEQAKGVNQAEQQLSDASEDATQMGSRQASTSSLSLDKGQAGKVKDAGWQLGDAWQDAIETDTEYSSTSSLTWEGGQGLDESMRQLSDASQDCAESG